MRKYLLWILAVSYLSAIVSYGKNKHTWENTGDLPQPGDSVGKPKWVKRYEQIIFQKLLEKEQIPNNKLIQDEMLVQIQKGK